jgi:hypothetical protein
MTCLDPGSADTGSEGRSLSDSVQPGCDRRGSRDRVGLGGQGKEGCLESIFSIGPVAQDPHAHAKDQALMPPNQQLKCAFIALADETIQKLGIVNVGQMLGGSSPDFIHQL